MKQVLVSVIIPAYNAEKYISEALDSVFLQNHENIEVIVINDGSSDSTLDVVKRYKGDIRIISQDNKGQAAARNVGIRQAKGEIIGLLDADDIWPGDHISSMVPYLKEGSSYDYVRGKSECIKDFGRGFERVEQKIFNHALVGTCLYKKSIFVNVGLFDETMRQGEDFDFNARLIEAGCKVKKIDTITLIYRRHENNLTSLKEIIAKGQLESLRKKIARAKSKPHTV